MPIVTGRSKCGPVVGGLLIICASMIYTHLHMSQRIRLEKDVATSQQRMALRFPVRTLSALQHNSTFTGIYSENRENQSPDIAKSLTTENYNGKLAMRQRASSVKENCKKRPLQEQTGAHSYIATTKTRAFAYYPIAKCGWTSWIAIMFENAGKKNYWKTRGFKWGWDAPYHLANMDAIPWNKARLYKERVIFVRNPYDRLVSAYKNKVLYGPYSAWMKRPCSWVQNDKPPITFPQFVRCIIDKVSVSDKSDIGSEKAAQTLDLHWKPQYWLSLPCSSSYTLVGKFDHMQEDLEAAVSILNLNVTDTTAVNQGKAVANETLGYWYKQLSEEDRQNIRQIYKLDFEVFGFDDKIPTD